jgi:hypothetical protein
MLPTAGTWTLIVSKEPSGFHTRYNGSADLGRVELRLRSLPAAVEMLTFAIDKNEPAPGGVIKMIWDTTEASAPFTIAQ